MTTATATAPTTRDDADLEPIHPVRLTRLVAVELSKMFDTRAGFWLVSAIGILAVVATAAAIAFAPDDAITYSTFAQAVGIPMSVLLPIIAILSVTGEYSQRTALMTYTLVPRRGLVIGGKALAALFVGIVGMVAALTIGALGNLVGALVSGVEPAWNVSAGAIVLVVGANIMVMTVGFMLGVLIRSSPGAIVGYFVYSLVLPGLLATLAAYQSWFADLQGWVDVNFSINRLYEDAMTAQAWAQLGLTSLIWIAVPLLLGVRAVLRGEVK
ncbi:MAG: ABC transporter permease [Mycobacteriaceae bacterium]